VRSVQSEQNSHGTLAIPRARARTRMIPPSNAMPKVFTVASPMVFTVDILSPLRHLGS
jgi:hypothetical protein